MSDRIAAESSFGNAISLAQRLGAKLFELRAALDLVRLWRDQGKVQQHANCSLRSTAGSPKASTRAI